MPPRLKELDALFQQSVADLKTARGELTKETEKAREEFPPLNEEQEEDLAEHYRSGEAGEAMADIQQRVDAGEFTWDDIRFGRTGQEVTDAYFNSLRGLGPMMRAA